MREMNAHRRATTTSTFGVSRREAHDASAFYDRFTSPEISTDDEVAPRKDVDSIFVHDARSMVEIDDRSVALVVTSPPYFAGKEYETALGEGGVPATYARFLEMLEEVFAQCVAKLEPGGRIAINVANLGRKPYRSLAADVTWILQDRLRLLLRGEVVWQKGRATTGSCAWGSFQRPANPVLRDLTERVVIASKGRFDRALSTAERKRRGLPHEASITRDEFLEATTDLWQIPAESATRVGHPAPFPIALPERLIHLYTYRGDLVLDPFMGSGTSAVAAVRAGRHFVGYETDASYAAHATERVAAELKLRSMRTRPSANGRALGDSKVGDDISGALRAGLSARDLVSLTLLDAGFADLEHERRVTPGLEVTTAKDGRGRTWHFDLAGGFTSVRPGLQSGEALWRTVGRASAHAAACPGIELVVLTTARPASPAAGGALLDLVVGPGRSIRDVVVLGSTPDHERLRAHGARRGEVGGET